jgi:predicted PurR-regulated permease PerM
MYTQWKPATRYIVGVGLFIFGIYVFYLSRSVLTLFVIAALIAFLVRPIIGFLKRRLRFPLILAVFTTYLVVAVVIVLAPLVLIPPIINAVNFFLGLDYQALIENTVVWFENTLLGLKDTGIYLFGFNFVLDSVVDPILALMADTGPVVIPQMPPLSTVVPSIGQAFAVSYGVAVGVVGTVASSFVALMFIILSSIYLSLDGQKFYEHFLSFIPEDHRSDVQILSIRLRDTWDSFFRGQVTLMIIIGVTVWLGLLALGLPGAYALGIIAGLLEIIPNLGPTMAAIPAVIVALLLGSSYLPINNIIFAFIIIGFYVLVNMFENTIVAPRVVGGSVKIHPLLVFIGVLVGVTVWGILGALLAAPIIASAREIINYLYCRVLGENPFPPQEDLPDQEVPSIREQVDELKTKAGKFLRKKPEDDEITKESPEPEPEKAVGSKGE